MCFGANYIRLDVKHATVDGWKPDRRPHKAKRRFRSERGRANHAVLSRSRYDHILKWELFQLADLDTYQGMLKLLFMKELERIVKLYEAFRQALLSELEHRKQRQQWYQQHAKNF